jgi:hypothetical protein
MSVYHTNLCLSLLWVCYKFHDRTTDRQGNEKIDYEMWNGLLSGLGRVECWHFCNVKMATAMFGQLSTFDEVQTQKSKFHIKLHPRKPKDKVYYESCDLH